MPLLTSLPAPPTHAATADVVVFAERSVAAVTPREIEAAPPRMVSLSDPRQMMTRSQWATENRVEVLLSIEIVVAISPWMMSSPVPP